MKYNYECFKIFGEHYIFDGQSQVCTSVKKETWQELRELKNGKSLNEVNQKSQKFIKNLFLTNSIQEYQTQKAPDFEYSENMLSLVHTQRCNLRCAYCFAHEKTAEFDMNSEIAIKAIDYFVKNVFKKDSSISIDLTGSGEPLVHRDFIKDVVNYINKLRQNGTKIQASIITNGMLLDEDAQKFILKNNIVWGISLDGDKIHHEQSRIGSNYDKIIQNYLELKSKSDWKHFGIRATYHAKNFNITQIFESLYKVGYGCKISINPCRGEIGSSLNFTQENIRDLLNEYDEFCKHILNFTLELDTGRIDSYFSGESYLRKFIISIINNTRTIYRCSAGIQTFAVDKDGQIFICTSLSGKNQANLGNIYDGIDLKKQEKIRNIYADNLPVCTDCWARYNCAGSCMAESLSMTGDFGKQIPVMCKLNKHLLKLAIYYCHQVYTKRPDMMDYIQRKYA